MRKIFCAIVLVIGISSGTSSLPHWTLAPWFPNTGRSSCTSFVIGDEAFVGLGYDGVNFKKSFYIFYKATNQWYNAPDFLGFPRSAAVSFVLGTNAYVGTGSGLSTYGSDLWKFNSVTLTWSQAADLPTEGRHSAIAFAVNNHGYVGLGYSSLGYKKDIWQYTDTTNSWMQKNDFDSTGLKLASVFVIGDKAFVVNGDKGVLTNGCRQYDALADNWIQKADFAGSPRSSCVAFTLEGKGIVGLGYDTAFQFRNDFMRYDTASDTWSPFDSLPAAARSGAIAFAFPTRAYVGFGYDSLYLKDTYYYAALNDDANEIVANEKAISIYPNPAVTDFTVRYSLHQNHNYFFLLYDLNGKQWMNMKLDATQNALRCNTSSLPSGIYFYQITAENKAVAEGKLVVVK